MTVSTFPEMFSQFTLRMKLIIEKHTNNLRGCLVILQTVTNCYSKFYSLILIIVVFAEWQQ